MKKTLKTRFAAIILSVLTIPLAACADKENKITPRGVIGTEYLYKSSSADISEEIIGDFGSFSYQNGKIYFFSQNVTDEENGISEYYLNSSAADGTGFSSVLLGSGNSYISPPAFDKEGKIYYVEVTENEDEHNYFLKATDENGNGISSADITEYASRYAPDIKPTILRIIGNNIFIADYSSMLIFGLNGGYINSITETDWTERIISDKNGEPYAYLWTGSGYQLRHIDISDGSLGDVIDIPFEGYSNYIFDGSGYDFFVSDGTALFGYDIGGEKTELFKWIDSGVSIIEVSDIFCADDEKFICAGRSFAYKTPKYYTVEKKLTEIVNKQEIVLGYMEYSIDGVIENSIVKFNSTSDKYHITVKKYLYEESDKLDLDIISGNIPDILFTGPYTPTDDYINKGLFADIYEFIDADSELSRDDFVPNLLRSCETDGKLYRFTDRFKVYTVIGKSSIFGDSIGSLTIDRLNEVIAGRPESTEILPAMTKNNLLQCAMEISGNKYINAENRTCSFDSDGFVKILEHADTYLNELDSDSYFDSEFWKRFETMFADESALLMTANLTDYADIYRFEKVNFGEKVTAVGFPCDEGNGTSFIVDTEFSISADPKCREGAWEFIRTLLLPEHQDSVDCFAVRNDSLKKAASAAMKHDPDRVNYATVTMGDMMISAGAGDIGEPSKKDIGYMNEIISSADGLFSYDQKIMDIISEEAAGYFGGKISSKEAAARIQTRAQLYLDEKS